MLEKRNIIESGRTPRATKKTADVVDEGVAAFRATGLTKEALKKDKKEKTDAAK